MTAPLLALATYIAIAAFSYRNDGLRFLSPGIDLSVFSDRRPVGWWSPAATAFFIASAAAVLVLLAARRRWLGVPLLALAVTAATPIVRSGEDAFVVDPRSETLVCRDGTTAVCLFQRHSGQLATVTNALQPVLAGLDAQVRVVESYRSSGQDELALSPLYVGPTLTGGADMDIVRGDVATGLLRWGCGDPPYATSDDVNAGAGALGAWLAARPGRSSSGPDLAELTDDQLLTATRDYRAAAAAAACDERAALRAVAPLGKLT